MSFGHQEPHLVLTVKIQEKSPDVSGRERGNVTIVKYAQVILHYRCLPTKGNYSTRALSDLGVGMGAALGNSSPL